MQNVTAVLFAKSLDHVGRFYQESLGLSLVAQDEQHMVLRTSGFDLVIHQIPEHVASHIDIEDPPKRRESVPVKLWFPVRRIEEVRSIALSLGGSLDPEASQWLHEESITCMGHDPEGNIFQVSQIRAG